MIDKEEVNDDIKSKIITLTKKEEAGYEYDDGLNIRFEMTKPGHISLYCMTDKVEDDDEGRIYEACDVRLYFLNATQSEYEDDDECPDQPITTKIKRGETPVFFRFGMQKHIKLNANIDFVGPRQEAMIWHKIDLVLEWIDRKVTHAKLYINNNYTVT